MGWAAVAIVVKRLELIGDNYRWHLREIDTKKARCPHLREYIQVLRYGRCELRPWIARLTSPDPKFGFVRQFLRGQKDYSQANSIGSRGIFEYFALFDGVYEVNECIKLGKTRRYFIRVQDAQIAEIGREEVLQCLTNDTNDTSE